MLTCYEDFGTGITLPCALRAGTAINNAYRCAEAETVGEAYLSLVTARPHTLVGGIVGAGCVSGCEVTRGPETGVLGGWGGKGKEREGE